jgi:hypothetical protein
VFCSEDCLTTALDTYHPMEAKLVSTFANSGLIQEQWYLALRAVLRKGLGFFLENRKYMFTKHDTTYGANLKEDDLDQVYLSDCYKSMFNLVSLDMSWPVSMQHFKAFTAFYFLKCLQKVNFFGTSQKPPGDDLSRDELYIAKLLLHFMSIASLNSHEVGVFETSSSMVDGYFSSIGCSIDPTLDLLNQSCDPNVVRFQNGITTILVANRDITEGDEVKQISLGGSADTYLGSREVVLRTHFEKSLCKLAMRNRFAN